MTAPRQKNVRVSQLREPALPARASIDDEQLDELEASIRQLGVLQPLVVFPVGEGVYEVAAGHRRLLAARRIGLEYVPVTIREDDHDAQAVKVHENAFREQLNPVDEALLYAQLYEQLGNDTERVASATGRSRDLIEDRLLLLSGDARIRDALQRGEITLGIAEQLNKLLREEDRGYYLDYVVRAGGSIRIVRQWVQEANVRARENPMLPPAAPASGEMGKPAGPIEPPTSRYLPYARPGELSSSLELRDCLGCGERDQEWRMIRKFFCAKCQERVLLPIEQEKLNAGN